MNTVKAHTVTLHERQKDPPVLSPDEILTALQNYIGSDKITLEIFAQSIHCTQVALTGHMKRTFLTIGDRSKHDRYKSDIINEQT